MAANPPRAKRAPPKLPASAFQAPPPPARRQYPTTLVDAHFHAWDDQQLQAGTIAWPLTSEYEQLRTPHTVAQLADLSTRGVKLVDAHTTHAGAVYVQAEAVHDDADEDGSQGGWDAAIAEVDAVLKASRDNGDFIKGVVPWAPVHHGAAALELYVARLKELPSLSDPTIIKSFRYLLQDSPQGFFLTPKFIEGLQWLGVHGYAFDATFDSVQQPFALEDAIEMIQRTREGQEEGKETRFIFDHLSKPNLVNEPTIPPSKQQVAYIRSFFAISLFSGVSLKLSALLDSAEPSLVLAAFKEFRERPKERPSYDTLKRRILTFLEPALEAFGDSRIIAGSDWPMFRAKVIETGGKSLDPEEEAAAWAFALRVYLDCLTNELGCDGESLDRIFAGNAHEFYRL